MKKHLIKKDDNSITIMWTDAEPAQFLPDGWSVVADADQDAAQATYDAQQLAAARSNRLDDLRAARAPKLKRADMLVNLAVLNSWTAPEKTELKAYRQALLDITAPYKADMSTVDAMDLNAITWPTEPTES